MLEVAAMLDCGVVSGHAVNRVLYACLGKLLQMEGFGLMDALPERSLARKQAWHARAVDCKQLDMTIMTSLKQ